MQMKVRLPRIALVALRGVTSAVAGTVLVAGTAAGTEPRPAFLIHTSAQVAAPVDPPRPSAWQDHRWQLAIAAVLIVGNAVLVAGLVLGHRRRQTVQRELDDQRRFESLLADLAGGFVTIPSDEIDRRITDGLRRTIHELGLDRLGFAELAPGGTELRVTHAVAREGVTPPRSVFTAEAWPWTLARLRRGEEIRIGHLANLPEEAARDRASFETQGTRACLVLPLMVSGGVLGGLACTTQREREWSEPLLRQLRPLADLFAVVLMRRRADRALQASESRFHQLADAAPIMMWVTGPDGHAIEFNRSWLTFTGRALADEVGDGWVENVHPDDRAPLLATYREAVHARRPYAMEYRLRRADGVYRAVLDNGMPSIDAAGVFQGFVGCTVDVTDVKDARTTLLDNLALRSSILGSLYGQIAAVDRDGVILAVNEGWTTSLEEKAGDGRTAGVGVNYFDVCRRAVADGDLQAQTALDAIESVLTGRSPRARLEYPCSPASGLPQWYAMVVEPFKRPEGGLVISHINITRRRLAEEEVQRERQELAHALRVATLGGLATSLAHEINQPLAAIASNAQAARRLLESADVDPDVPAALHDIADAAQRAAQIIRRLRVLLRKEQGDPRPVDLEDVIKEVIALIHRELEHRRVRVALSIAPGLPRVLGDMVQLQQVILNVCINAVEAMAGAAHPRQLKVDAFVREPGLIGITLADTGSGVPASELAHIFERFVTSKPDGLGMGLSISYSIVTAHGGRMWATRNDARGLTVHIELPSLEG
jgi:PAS domain S-box-containing protein